MSLVATRGYGAAETLLVYRRSTALCRQLGRQPSPPVLRGLALASMAHAEFDQAHAFGDQLIALANQREDPTLEVEGHYVVGVSLFWKGIFVSSREHLEQALAHTSSDYLVDHLRSFAQDPRVVCLIRLAVDLWLLGYVELAQQKMAEAVHQAHQLAHPFSLAYVMNWAMNLATLRRDVRFVADQAETCLAQSREHGMDMWLMEAMVLRGWATAEQGDVEQGIAEMRRGMAAFRAAGNRFITPFFLGLLAEQYGKIGRVQRGLSLISQALMEVERSGGRWYEAELYRCRGILALARNDAVEAELALERALAIARAQSAKAIELRIATTFAQLRLQQARFAEGSQLLEATCAWFGDSAATPDLVDAHSALAACRAQLA